MKRRVRRRRHTSNWVYTIVAVCFLLVTLCIISLIPGNSAAPDNTGITPSPGLSGNTVSSESLEQTPPSDPYITITINKEKFAALIESYQATASAPSAQTLEEIHLQLQELSLAREELNTEREEFRTLYETASERFASEQNDYLKKQTQLQTETEHLKNKLEETEAQLSKYNDKTNTLETERQRLADEEKELQQAEDQLQHLQEDIIHAREQLGAERHELETGIQSIKGNPNLSSESKETALIPLYAALEQLLMREAQLEHSEAEYEERSEVLLAAKENLATRLQEHNAEYDQLDKLLAPHKKAQQEQTEALKAAEAQLLPITSELERLEKEEAALGKEYQDKLAALDTEEARITEEEQNLKQQAAALQTPDADASSPGPSSEQAESEQATLAQRTLERILITLQDVSLSENSNISSDILLTDVADIMITTPEPDNQLQDTSRTLPDSSEAGSSDSHRHNN